MKKIIFAGLLAIFLFSVIPAGAQEEMTTATYYQAPYGEYSAIRETGSEGDENPSYITISISPLYPRPTDEVDFRITASDRDGISSISLFVNDENVITCNSSPCDYRGGPYLDGFSYYGSITDTIGNVVLTEPVPKLKDTDGDGVSDDFDNCPTVYNPDQVHIDTDADGIADTCDNCPLMQNADQSDSDKDGFGNACDNCPNHFNPDQNPTDSDGDSTPDTCDNCLNHSNPDQDDWNNDGVGNECDCNDNFRGDNEHGADCGGICDKVCPTCTPLIISGDPDIKLDIVFVKDINYTGSSSDFLDDAMQLIEKGMFGSTEFYNNRCKFNFYWSSGWADYVPKCQKFDVSDKVWKSCPFADSVVIAFDEKGLACSTTNVFSAPTQNLKTIVHEAGHQFFSLADEYCCGGSYWQLDLYPSVFKTEGECKKLSQNPNGCKYLCPPEKCWPGEEAIGNSSGVDDCINWYNSHGLIDPEYKCSCEKFASKYGMDPELCTTIDANECDEFWKDFYSQRGVTDSSKLTVQSPNMCQKGDKLVQCCPDGWWRSDTSSDYMESGNQFDPDCSLRVQQGLNIIPACLPPGAKIDPGKVAGLIFINKFNFKDNKISLIDTKILDGTPPNYLNDVGAFKVLLKSSQDNELKNILISDPAEFKASGFRDDFDDLIGEHVIESVIYKKDNVNFTLVLPFLEKIRFIEFRYSENDSLVAEFDLSETILDYCRENNYEAEECRVSDLDNDAIIDSIDNCPLENPQGLDANLDGCTDTIEGLYDNLQSIEIQAGVKNSLLAKVSNALSSLTTGEVNAAINQLGAFINQVEAQSGKKISQENADVLAGFAQNVIQINDGSQLQLACVQPPSGIIGWWSGDNAFDLINGNNAVLHDDTNFASGKVGNAFNFDGIGDYASIPYSSDLEPSEITVEFWVSGPQMNQQPGNTGSGVTLIENSIANYQGWSIFVTPSMGIGTVIGDGTQWNPVISNFGLYYPTGWRHVAMTYDGTYLQLYLDGAPQLGPLGNQVSNAQLSTGRDINIGASWNNGNFLRFFKGLIDEVEIYDRALSVSEIQSIYNAGSAGKCKPNVCVAAPSNLVGWWTLDDAVSSSVADDRASGNDGTVNGATLGVPGKVSTAADFDGVDDYIEVPDNADLNIGDAITIDAWVKLDSLPSVPAMVVTDGKVTITPSGVHLFSEGYMFTINNQGKITFRYIGVDGLSRWLDSTGNLSVGTWHHIAVTFEASTALDIYIDGQLDATYSYYPSFLIPIKSSAEPLTIGTFEQSFFLDGKIDELEIFNRALSPFEIWAIYNAGTAGKCKPLMPADPVE